MRIPGGEALEAAYKCRYCAKRFSAAKEWSAHQDEHANDPRERKYSCEFCDKMFKQVASIIINNILDNWLPTDIFIMPLLSCILFYRCHKVT